MDDHHRCTRCQAAVGDATQGLCPRCLLLRDQGVAAETRPRTGEAGATLSHTPTPSPGATETPTVTIGAVPRVPLDDTAPGEPAPTDRPAAVNGPSLRYRIDGEIGRGGMGAVLKGRDRDLGRDVAIKVLRDDLGGDADVARRFVEEAQIGGQLQHPGVVPIYELGTFADRRPFFSMKLVKGRTMAELLSGRSTPADDLPRFLSIFAAIAQTMAYAHTRGVIHRDLKPSNVMVGSFGEVQVMDWGLAKVLARGGVADEAHAAEQSVIATARSESDTDHSRAGSIMGTPAYMAPCQARGETDRIDERVDVFALGSILCEVLTGRPAFTGRGSTDVLRRAARGDTADALTRLEGCGAEAELIALAKDCLAVEREDRPRDANVVAERITAYLAGVQERVQAAERERAVAVAKAIEERRRRKVQLALAASVLGLVTLGGLSTSYYLRQQEARAAAGQRIVDKVTTLRGQAVEHPEEIRRWEVALAAVQQADPAGDPKARAQLVALQEEIQAGLDAARRDQELLDRLVEIRLAEADDQNGAATDVAYADAFHEAGIDLASLTPAEAGARIKARPPSVAPALAVALDDWAAIRRGKRADAAGAARLAEAARVADPDPWRNKLRDALDRADKAARLAELKALAESAKSEDRGAISLHLLGNSLRAAGDRTLAESVLRTAHQRHPRDLWVNYDLGRTLANASRLDEAIRFLTAARAIRPESAHELAHVLERRGEPDEALDVFRELKRLRPGNARNLVCMGTALHGKGLTQESDETNRAAVAAGREEIRRHPDDALAHANLGIALKNLGQLDEAIAEGRAAIRLKPDLVQAHNLLGTAQQGQAKFDEAIAEYRTAIRLDPDDAASHGALGHVLQNTGAIDEAITECQTAIRLQPAHAEYHFNLGHAFMVQGKLDEAVAALREAIRLYPDYAEALCNLGVVLQNQGDFAGAVEMLRKGHRVGSARPGWRYPSAQWVAEVERDLARVERDQALTNRLPAVLRGEDKPRDNAERLTFAQVAFGHKHFAGAARLWAEALEIDPKLGDDRQATHRYNAACAAALASSGRGKDEPPPDDAAKVILRQQALDWLKAELATWTGLLESDPTRARPAIVQALSRWKQASDLAAIRDAEALAGLPEPEREGWQALWAEVDRLLKRESALMAEEPKPAPGNPEELAGIHKRAHELAASKPDEAEPLFRQALAGYRRAEGPDGALTLDLTMDLANLLNQSGRGAEAEPLFRDALEQFRKRFGPGDPRMSGILAPFGLNLLQQGKWAEAEPVLRECLTLREKAQPDVWSTFNTRSTLGGSLLGQKKYDEAEPLILSGYEGMKGREATIPPPGRPRLTEAAERVVKLYEDWGKPDKAAEWRAKLAKPSDESKP